MDSLASISFGVTAAGYLAVSLLLAAGAEQTAVSRRLIAANLATAVWAAGTLILIWRDGTALHWSAALDAARAYAWLLFLSALLPGVVSRRNRRRLMAAVALPPAALAVVAAAYRLAPGVVSTPLWPALMEVLVALAGLFAIEQVYRNRAVARQSFIVPVCVGVGTLFAYDLLVYTDAMLFGRASAPLWMARGLAAVVAAPALLLAAKRNPQLGGELSVSRQAVLYTGSALAGGLYLLAMSAAGWLIRRVGGEWGVALQAGFLVAAVAVLAAAVLSPAIRARYRVFVAKHFFRNRYDYRLEWLRLSDTLSGNGDAAPLAERGVRAICQVLGSDRGFLWTRSADGVFESDGGWNVTAGLRPLPADSPLPRFLDARRWVLDSVDYRRDPARYDFALEAFRPSFEGGSVFVPLQQERQLFGFVEVERPAALPALNFEDHDLLKTAGRQVAAFLAQQRAQEMLAQTRQFEAFSKLAAFMTHDLKNVMAQQTLLLRNAARHRRDPGFVDDMIRTVEASAARVGRLLEQLQRGRSESVNLPVDLNEVMVAVARSCSDRRPRPQLTKGRQPAMVEADRHRLQMALEHAVRNAQDASAPDGCVELRLTSDGESADILVTDNGRGMDAEFVRRRLFRPFDSTKGSQGMGIGAYQLRECARSLGGRVQVQSAPGRGTTLTVSLPLAGASSSPVAPQPVEALRT